MAHTLDLMVPEAISKKLEPMCVLSWFDLSVKSSTLEQILLSLRLWLYGIEDVQCFGWQLSGDKY